MLFKCRYWLSSPGAENQFSLVYIRNDGVIYGDFLTSEDGRGFRPVVCLKEGVNLIEKTNGTIKTYELE